LRNDVVVPRVDHRRLFVFDMDGTLLPDATGMLALAGALRTVAEVEELERQFAAGTLDTLGFTTAIHRLWGVIPPEVARAAFDQCAKLEEIREVTSDIARNGDVSCLITMSQNVFADHFLEFGFDHVRASTYPTAAGAAVREVDVLTPDSKPVIVRELCDKHGLDYLDTVAFGDSGSDLPLFRELRHTVSVNGTPAIGEVSAVEYRGNSLLAAYRLALDLVAVS
jgi:phosphoserine phosphatase